MRRKPFEKLLSILFVLLLISQPLVAAYAEGGDFSAEPADAVVQENDAVALPAEETDTPSWEEEILNLTPAGEENPIGASPAGDGSQPASTNDGDAVPPEQTAAPQQEQSIDPPAEETDDSQAVEPPAEGSGEEPPVEEDPDAVEGYETRRFDETIAANWETWSNVNLVRASDFTGKLARITGTLTLNNVLIAGTPARSVDLLSWFDLAPGARIVCSTDAALAINLHALSINKGSSATLKLTWKGKKVNGKKARWTTSNAKLVSVSAGKIKAKKAGTAYVTAKYKKQSVVCRLDITGFVYAKSIKVKKSLTLALFNGTRLSASITPKHTTDKTVTWSSSKPNVVSVDENGNIAALAAGKANIYARTVNGKTAKCTVTVKVVMPKAVDFQRLYVTLHPGDDFQSRAVISPANASYTGLQYTSSDPSVAAVDEQGAIHAVSCGTATITARSTAKASAVNTCKVCVINPEDPPLTGLVIGLNPGHQVKTIKKLYPIAPGSRKRAKGVKTGAGGRYTHQPEYQVVLQVGLKLKRILEEQGATVVITRTTNNVMLTNIDRAKMLNAAGVDVALQLHCNSWKSSKSHGSSCYIRTTGSWVAESRALAKNISKTMSQYTGFKNLGVKVYNEYMSLNWTTTPSVLLEMGYLSNRSDDLNLAKDEFREKLAYGIYVGLCQYFGREVA